ncbi:unnamed protein product [Didymodactylos carnosus]|uniref:Uncharacterized protein n=1 Tax=Didymodactylos carnosus TaxID=1234261 RepID=A0A814UEU2_9BILA|nr:unnamed protein product [Didymodactylos carnosus]CAF3937575.1 unnamed protein product [Didymodactylos carnosus]
MGLARVKSDPYFNVQRQNSRPYRPFVPGNSGQTYERNFNERPWQQQQQHFVRFNDPYFNGSVNRQGGAVLTPHQRQRRTRLNRARRDREERAANQLGNQADALPVDNRFACFLDQDENDEIPLDECTAATTSTAKTPIDDAWIRDNYEYQVIEKLLEIGMEDKHWVHEIVKKTKTRDDIVNNQYCIDKISQLQRAISNHGNAVTKLQSELIAFVPYYHDAPGTINNNGTVTAHDLAAQNARKPKLHIRAADNITQEYLKIHTKKFAEICANRVNTAYAELKECVNLKTFEEKATPVQRAHVKILKEKLEILHGKQKTAKLLKEEISMQMIPRAVPNVHFSPRLDDRVLGKDNMANLTRVISTVVEQFRVKASETLLLIAEIERVQIETEIEQLEKSMPPNAESEDSEGPKASDLYKLFKADLILSYVAANCGYAGGNDIN